MFDGLPRLSLLLLELGELDLHVLIADVSGAKRTRGKARGRAFPFKRKDAKGNATHYAEVFLAPPFFPAASAVEVDERKEVARRGKVGRP